MIKDKLDSKKNNKLEKFQINKFYLTHPKH